jgi:hypothetical protein
VTKDLRIRNNVLRAAFAAETHWDDGVKDESINIPKSLVELPTGIGGIDGLFDMRKGIEDSEPMLRINDFSGFIFIFQSKDHLFAAIMEF